MSKLHRDHLAQGLAALTVLAAGALFAFPFLMAATTLAIH